MRSASKKSLIIILAIVTFFPWPVFAARSNNGRGLSIVVVPLIDGDSDGQSRDIAREIGRALKFSGKNHVIDTDITARVVEYSGGEKQPASNEIASAADALAAAKEKYFGFRYEEAEADLARSIGLLENQFRTNTDAGSFLVDAYVSRAVIAKSRGETKKMRESLLAALKINPKLDLKAEEYPPSIVSVFEEERAALRSLPAGTIAVSSSPAAAEVYLNGILQGAAPLELNDIPAGPAIITLKANRYNPVEKRITVAAGGRIKISEKLKWASEDSPQRVEKTKNASDEVHEALRVADAMKAEKAVVIDADQVGKTQEIKARMVDANLRAGHRQIVLRRGMDDAKSQTGLADLTGAIDGESQIDLTKDPARHIDPLGIAKPILLDKRKRHFEKSPIFWGVMGALIAGAVGGGMAAAMSGGGGGGNQTGNVQVNFR